MRAVFRVDVKKNRTWVEKIERGDRGGGESEWEEELYDIYRRIQRVRHEAKSTILRPMIINARH